MLQSTRWRRCRPSLAQHRPTVPQGLEGGVTAAALESPAGAALVQCCVQLYDRLAALTRLDDPDLLPAVGGVELRWRDGLSVSPHHVCCCLVG